MPRGIRKTTATGDARIADGKTIGAILAKHQAADRTLVMELAGEWVRSRDAQAAAQAPARKRVVKPVAPTTTGKTTPKTPDRQARAIGAVAGEDGKD